MLSPSRCCPPADVVPQQMLSPSRCRPPAALSVNPQIPASDSSLTLAINTKEGKRSGSGLCGLSSVLSLEGAGSQAPVVAAHLWLMGSSVAHLRTLPAGPRSSIVLSRSVVCRTGKLKALQRRKNNDQKKNLNPTNFSQGNTPGWGIPHQNQTTSQGTWQPW